MIGVLVAAAHQLAQSLAPMRSIVVAAGEVERANRVVRRADREDADAARGRGRVADDRALRRLDVLAETAAAIAAPADKRVRTWRFGRSRTPAESARRPVRSARQPDGSDRPAGRRADASRRASSRPAANVMLCQSVASGTLNAPAMASHRWSRARPARSNTSARRALGRLGGRPPEQADGDGLRRPART